MVYGAQSCVGALHLHFGESEVPNSLFAGFPNAGVFGQNPDGVFPNKQTTRGEYRYSVLPECVFLRRNRSGKLRSSSWGCALKNFIGFLDLFPDLTGLQKANKENIQKRRGLITRQPIDHKRGPIGDKILKLLV